MAITSLTHILTAPFYSKRPFLSEDGRFLVVYVEGSTEFLGGKQYTSGLVILDLVDGSVVPMTPPPLQGEGKPYPEFVGMNQDASQVFFSSITTPSSGARTVYMTDGMTGATVAAASFPSAFGPMSGNGRYMLAQAQAEPGQVFGGLQWHDRQTGAMRPVESLANTLRDGPPRAIGVSDDGRTVMFHTYSSNVVAGDTNQSHDYFVQDMLTGRAAAVQSSTDGTIGNGYIFNAVMSANGRYVAFDSNSTNLVADGAAFSHAAYVKDLQTGALVRISEDAAGKPLEFGASVSSISADGRYATMVTHTGLGLPGALEYGPNIVVKDLQTGGIGLVNRSPSVVTSTVEASQISANGEMVTYMGVKMEDAPSLHPVFHVFVAPRPAITTAEVSSRFSGSTGADTFAGALGSDIYDVNHYGDIVIEHPGQGGDLVVASVDNYVLPENVEFLHLAGAARNANGNALDNLLRGTAADNVLRGGAGNDVLEGYGGSDTLYGDAGFDIASFTGSIKDYTFTRTSWRHEVAKTGGGPVSYLQGIEHLKFADAEVTFETTGTAAMAYRLYQAAFDRKPDLEGLGYWISRLASGMTIDAVAQNFVDSLEFKTVFGVNPSNTKLVDGMYRHVLHRTPDAAGVDFWVGVMDRGAMTQAELLKSFSESAENQDALIGIIGHGIAYTPYGG